MMGDSEPELLCYNRGCGQTYKESANSFDACRFHPGTPYFHDAYKGWTCCRKSVDFTEFLNMKGCATGYHSNVKPPEPEKPKQEVRSEEVIEVTQPQPRVVQKERPSVDAPLVRLIPTLSESLKKQTLGARKDDRVGTDGQEVLKVGVTQCVNKGCTKTYQGPETDTETCKFHPGVPIFHEGLKFWSCCQKRTTDFDVFMRQEGCQLGTHCWVKPKSNEGEGGTVFVKCRNDWHQDGSFVHVVIYAGGKKFDPECSSVQVNGVKLRAELYFPEEHSKYEEEWVLAGIILPEQSSVLMTPMKLEIKLRKAEPVHWANLSITEAQQRAIVAAASKADECKSVGVDPVDLSDL